ncbi:hypothetical protein LTR50_006806 [Elasticomyces elasticus]|nr:hypothetical protein LTR50_006806 [Elasticomyces elasticus]
MSASNDPGHDPASSIPKTMGSSPVTGSPLSGTAQPMHADAQAGGNPTEGGVPSASHGESPLLPLREPRPESNTLGSVARPVPGFPNANLPNVPYSANSGASRSLLTPAPNASRQTAGAGNVPTAITPATRPFSPTGEPWYDHGFPADPPMYTDIHHFPGQTVRGSANQDQLGGITHPTRDESTNPALVTDGNGNTNTTSAQNTGSSMSTSNPIGVTCGPFRMRLGRTNTPPPAAAPMRNVFGSESPETPPGTERGVAQLITEYPVRNSTNVSSGHGSAALPNDPAGRPHVGPPPRNILPRVRNPPPTRSTPAHTQRPTLARPAPGPTSLANQQRLFDHWNRVRDADNGGQGGGRPGGQRPDRRRRRRHSVLGSDSSGENTSDSDDAT